MFDRLAATLRALATGVSRPTASSCSGDPVAWEKDWARRRLEKREAEQAARGDEVPADPHPATPGR